MRDWLLIVVVALVALYFAMPGKAIPHEWYPVRCCNDRDCKMTRDVTRVAGGYISEGFFAPDEMVETSPDDDYHICWSSVEVDAISMQHNPPGVKLPLPKPICFFAPKALF